MKNQIVTYIKPGQRDLPSTGLKLHNPHCRMLRPTTARPHRSTDSYSRRYADARALSALLIVKNHLGTDRPRSYTSGAARRGRRLLVVAKPPSDHRERDHEPGPRGRSGTASQGRGTASSTARNQTTRLMARTVQTTSRQPPSGSTLKSYLVRPW
jgi:hypothetical protein